MKNKIAFLCTLLVLLLALNVLFVKHSILGDEEGVSVHGLPFESYRVSVWSTGAPPLYTDITLNYPGILGNALISVLVSLPLLIRKKKI